MKFWMASTFSITSVMASVVIDELRNKLYNGIKPSHVSSNIEEPHNLLEINNEYRYFTRLAIHMICYKNDREKIKNKFLKLGKKLLESAQFDIKSEADFSEMKVYWKDLLDNLEKYFDEDIFPKKLLYFLVNQYYIFESKFNDNQLITETKNNILALLQSNTQSSSQFNTDGGFLNLSSDYITASDVCNLIDSMKNSFQELNFNNPTVDYLFDVLDQISIKKLDCFPLLSISNINCDISNYEAILILLGTLNINSLSINNCNFYIENTFLKKFKRKNKISIFKTLDKSTTINHLSIRNISISEEDIKFISNALKNDKTPLNEITFINSNFKSEILFRNLFNNKKLKKLTFDSYKITDRFSENLSLFLKKSKTLETLVFTSNAMNSSHIKDISKGLRKNMSLTEIKLDYSTIKLKDFMEILKSITNNQKTELKTIRFMNKDLEFLNSSNMKLRQSFESLMTKIKEKNIDLITNFVEENQNIKD